MSEPKHTANNLIAPARVATAFGNPAFRFEVSSRSIAPEVDPLDYFKLHFMYLDLEQIESVFGNAVYPSRFYGGRQFDLEHSLTDRHIRRLNERGIGVTFTLTNHYFSEAVYAANRHFLRRYHRAGNGIVCTNDELAKRIRVDFPDYTIKASLIQHLNTVEKVERALDLYDRVVVPMNMNDDDDFLRQLPEKERIVLFGNADCAYNCPARTCYAAISQLMWGSEKKSSCSQSWLPRPELGHIFFDVEKFFAMGFRHFKLVPRPSERVTNFLKSRARTTISVSATEKRAVPLYSFPKCGRTWLRFMLAHYFNLVFQLEIPLDLQTLFTLLPNDDAGLTGVEHFQFGHVAGLPLVVCSHGNDTSRAGILLLRAIPDVVVSDYFQKQRLGRTTGSLAEFIRSPNGSLHRYCTYLNNWARDDGYKRQHVLTYEGLHRDAIAELERILTLLDIPIQESFLKQAVALSSFEHMQDTEKLSGHAGLPSVHGDPEMLKVRRGKVGGYVDYLSRDEANTLFETVDALLLPQAKAMLDTAGLAN